MAVCTEIVLSLDGILLKVRFISNIVKIVLVIPKSFRDFQENDSEVEIFY